MITLSSVILMDILASVMTSVKVVVFMFNYRQDGAKRLPAGWY